MKRLGSFLMAIGVIIGVLVALAMAAGVQVNGVPFLVAIGLAKLTLVTALGFLAAGAFVRRIGVRRERAEPAMVGRTDGDA